MSNLEIFDKSTATMRLLLTMRNHEYPMTRLTLLSKLREENVGRTAAYKALKVSENLGLVEETAHNVEGKRILTTDLTEKGVAMAFYIEQIQVILSRWGTSEYKPGSVPLRGP